MRASIMSFLLIGILNPPGVNPNFSGDLFSGLGERP
jgi:hypothetical protein